MSVTLFETLNGTQIYWLGQYHFNEFFSKLSDFNKDLYNRTYILCINLWVYSTILFIFVKKNVNVAKIVVNLKTFYVYLSNFVSDCTEEQGNLESPKQ